MKFKTIEKIDEVLKDKESDVIYTLSVKVTSVARLQNVTIFTIDDGKDMMQLVKYLPGQTAYADIVSGSIVTFSFKKVLYQGKVQGQVADVKEILPPQETKEKVVEKVDFSELFKTEDWKKLLPSLKNVGHKIAEAITNRQPIIISHHADCDGYCSALILETAILQKIKQRHGDLKYLNNYYTKNASKTPYYDISDATKDISSFQSNFSRTNNATPLIIIVDNGSTTEDKLAIEKVKIFGADVIVIDHHDPGMLDETGKSEVCKFTSAHANPHLVGLNKEFSTSMLCFKISQYISDEVTPNLFAATLGGVADKCSGEAIDKFVEHSKIPREYFKKLAKFVALEVFFTKYAYGELPILDLLKSKSEKQEKLIVLYEKQLLVWQNEVKDMVSYYSTKEKIGKFELTLMDGEKLTFSSDFFSIGKLTSFIHSEREDEHPEKTFITLVVSDSMIVYRVKQHEHLFDGNKLVAFLKESLPHARISGGGHDVAGSIKFIPAVKEELMLKLNEFVSKL